MPPENPGVPPHPNVHRSWSDEGIPVDHYSTGPAHHPFRSSSFSTSRAPHPQWDNSPPPPPVPPHPPSFLPAPHGPLLTDANRDISYPGAHQRSPSARQPWTGPYQSYVSSSYDFGHLVPPFAIPSAPSWPPSDPHFYLNPSPPFGFSTPAVLSRSRSYVPTTQSLGDRRVSLYGPAQNFSTFNRSPSPPPALPPRPPTSHGEVRFRNSPTLRSAGLPSVPPPPPPLPPPPPPLPPKILTSSVMSNPAASNHERTSTSPGQIGIATSPSNRPPIPKAQEMAFPSPETQTSDALPFVSDLKRALSVSSAESLEKGSTDGKLEDGDMDNICPPIESLTVSTNLDHENGRLPASQSSQTSIPASQEASEVTLSSVKLENASHDASYSNHVTETPSRLRSLVPFPSGQDILSSEELEDHEARGRIIQELEDVEVTRKLQEEENERLHAEMRERERQDEERLRMDEDMTKRLQEEEAERSEAERRERGRLDEVRAQQDAELLWKQARDARAQKLIRQAQERKDAEIARMMGEKSDPPIPSDAKVSSDPPPYCDVVSSPPAPGSSSQPAPVPVQFSRPGHEVGANVAGPERPGPNSLSDRSFTEQSAEDASVSVRRGNSSSSGVLRPESRDPSPVRGSSANPAAAAEAREDGDTEDNVLTGVSYGFTPPDIDGQSRTGSPSPPFPDVISLSRPPCWPFHIVAPSWRQLLRFLARQETRIEADLEAIAHAKENTHMRVVVQFAQLNKTSKAPKIWRTILHLTLDEPLPPNHPEAWRYNNGDPSVLPYSYSLGERIPYLVNSLTSQVYVVPLSSASPFPILPITLPNVALYLRSAMRDSRGLRKTPTEQPNGMRRLYKLVTSCYPEEVVQDKEDRKGSKGVGGLIKRVVGRGERGQRQGNEEVYDIITPFRIDQYTAS